MGGSYENYEAQSMFNRLIDGFLIAYIVIASFAALLYLPKLVTFRYAFRKPARKKATAKRKISVVVAARNESKTIPPLLDSIAKQNYDKSYFTLNVIVKDPADPTIELVKALGGNVFVVPEQSCKGDALDGYFKAIGNDVENFDAFVIVDADAVLSYDYVSRLNEALEYDCDIFITRKFNRNLYAGKNTRTLFSNCAALLWPVLDDLGNSWRAQHNVPLNLCGQGLMVRRGVIEKIGGWPYRTLTEDYELRLDSFVKGFTSMYYPYAVIHTEEATGRQEDYYRRLRWLTGYAQCDKKYRSQIKEQAKKRGKPTLGELDYLYGYFPIVLFALISVFTMCAGSLLTAIYAVRLNPLWNDALIFLVAMPFGVMYVLLELYALLAYLSCERMFDPLLKREKLAMMLFYPIYLLEFCPIYVRAVFYARKGVAPAWRQTDRVDYEKNE